jgi:drug/metabolite transporter (DMT)-like permease
MQKISTLDLKAIVLLVAVCLLWGFNAVAIKYANQGIAPIFQAGIRSLIAAACLMLWMAANRMKLFQGSIKDGIVIGMLFGLEFGLLYTALKFTAVSSAWILLYTSPFFHTLGAHFFLPDDRLSWNKGLGLILSFAGIVVLLSKHFGLPSMWELAGDLMAMTGAALWASTTVYIKRRVVGKISPNHTLFYQLLFSMPLLFLLSLLFREDPVQQVNGLIVAAVGFQAIIVAFLSYLIWFFLVHKYPVSRLSAFTFLTPVFASICGIIFLAEPLTVRLVLSLFLASVGIYIVNSA